MFSKQRWEECKRQKSSLPRQAGAALERLCYVPRTICQSLRTEWIEGMALGSAQPVGCKRQSVCMHIIPDWIAVLHWAYGSSGHSSSRPSSSREDQQHLELHFGKALTADEERWSFFFTQHWCGPIWSTGSSSGPPSKKRDVDVLERVQQRVVTVEMGLKLVSYDRSLAELAIINMYKYLKEGSKEDSQALFRGSRWQDKRQWAQQGTALTLRKHFLLHRLWSTGTSSPEDVGSPPWGPSEAGYGPGHPALSGSAGGGVGPRDTESPCSPVILWFWTELSLLGVFSNILFILLWEVQGQQR